MRTGYLLHRYPAISQAFILREVTALRALGHHIETFSVWEPERQGLLAEADRREAASTTPLLPARPWRLARAHLAALRRGPRAYLRVAVRALRAGGPDLRGRGRYLGMFVLAVFVWDRCRRRGITHLHTHFAGTPTHLAWLTTCVGNALDDARWTWSLSVHGPVEFFDMSAYRLPERAADALFVGCISDFARSQLMAHLGPEQWPKLHVVPCGVDPARFAPPAREADASGPVRLLSVGRLVGVKGQAILLQALAQLDGAVALTLVGDGAERERLHALASELGVADAVTFAGAVGQDDIPAYYRDADVFVLSSFAEGLPVVLMEAMAMAIPVVATRIAGVAELVEDGVTGLLVPPGRADRLAAALRRLAEDASLRARLGAAGRARVLGGHTVEHGARRLAALHARYRGDGSSAAAGALLADDHPA